MALAVAAILRGGSSASGANDNADDVLAQLNATINWYKGISTKIPPGEQPSDTIYVNSLTAMASQVVKLAFESAKAQVSLRSPNVESHDATTPGAPESGVEKYARLEREISGRIADEKAQVSALQSKRKTPQEAAQQRSLEGKLSLDDAALVAVQQMKEFASHSAGGTGLSSKIEELARSVPEAFESSSLPAGNGVATTASLPLPKAQPSNTSAGLFHELGILYDEMQTIRSIDRRIDEADRVAKLTSNLRIPLRNELSKMMQQGADLGQGANSTKEQYDEITQRFKQVTAATLPLSEQLLVLRQCRGSLTELKTIHMEESRTVVFGILSRVLVILVAIGLVLGLAEIWRRVAFRYVHDPKRRRQFLTLRRFVIGFFIFVAVTMGFASEFSSLATFAGFVTAGIAVGLQTVLLSVVAYLFIIGRFGISVGDRISVAGVTGDVIDVSLVRFYLLEYASTGVDLYPTGRIAVFSNAVLFQANTPLFKQLPGNRYTWHEVSVPLAADADFSLVRKALDRATAPAYQEFGLEKNWLQSGLDQGYSVSIQSAEPRHRLQFTDRGAELVARYPVEVNRGAEVDNKVDRLVREMTGRDEILAQAIAGSPRISLAVKT